MNKIFFIHGWCMPPGIWDDVQQKLKAQRPELEITTAEMPGYECGGAPSTNPASADDLLDSLFEQAPESSHWCGWSLGATLALMGAMRTPSQVQSLTLVSPTPCFSLREGWEHGVDERVFAKLLRLMERDFHRGWQRFVQLQVAGHSEGEENIVEETISRFESFHPSIEALTTGKDVLNQVDLRKELCQISVPTEIIAGTQDQVVPFAASDYLQTQIEDSQLEATCAGHLLPITHPDLIVAATIQQLDRELQVKGDEA